MPVRTTTQPLNSNVGSALFARSYARYCLLAGFFLTAGASLLSEGVYHEDDLKHYLYAQWSWHDAHYLLDEWGRAGFTIPYALPAGLGSAAIAWHACRLLSVVLTAVTAWLSYRIADQFKFRHAWLAIPFFYLQPLVTHLSLTTLTETPLAFYLALATWLLLAKRPTASAAVIALAPLTRHEAIILLALWLPALWRVRANGIAYAVLWWAIIAHNILAALFLNTVPLLAFFAPDGSSQYGSGTPLSFVPALMLAAGHGITALAIIGIRRVWKRPTGWMIAIVPAVYFLTHTLLYIFGSYSTGGYARFLVPISPLVAVLAAAGAGLILTRKLAMRRQAFLSAGTLCILFWLLVEIEWFLRPPQLTHRWYDAVLFARIAAAGYAGLCLIVLYRIRGDISFSCRMGSKRFLAATAVVIMLASALWAIVPLRLTPQQHAIQEATEWLKTADVSVRPLIAVNYWAYYFSDRWLPQIENTVRHKKSLSQQLTDAEPGTLFLWDARFCTEPDYNLSPQSMRNHPDWREIWAHRKEKSDTTTLVAIYEKMATQY